MQIKWGNYSHTENETQLVRYDVQPRKSQRGQRLELVYRAHLRGELKDSTGQAAITAKIQALIAAYDQNYQDFVLLDNSGNSTPHSFLNSDQRNVSGNRVVYRSWDGIDGAEYANMRTYEIVVEAVMAEPESNLVYLTERFTYIGTGGPVWSADNTQYGPQDTPLYPSSWIHVMQDGYAVYYTGPATAQSPIFPANSEHLEQRRRVPMEPQFRGQGYTHYPISWHYSFSIKP